MVGLAGFAVCIALLFDRSGGTASAVADSLPPQGAPASWPDQDLVPGGRVELSPAARRFLPADQDRPRLELLARSPADIFRFDTGEASVEILADGTLWAVRNPMTRADLPVALSRTKAIQNFSRDAKIDHLWLMAYELETVNSDGTHKERFVDPLGHELLEIVKREDHTRAITKPPAEARIRIEQLSHGAPILSLREEAEWGETIIAASWNPGDGLVEAKVLADGRVLYWELPTTEPIPRAVSAQPSDDPPEALLLEAFSFTMGTEESVYHSTGREVSRR
ncbi:MAG: hypothetical protein K8J08_07275 [Thermoanaerobaculia bacterium]|nr:hypothetical protein [Thermoanaerobaculia bacterium]